MNDYIPVNEPLLRGNERRYLAECIDTGWISSEGPFVDKFEKQFSEYVGSRYGTAVCNGSAALDIAVAALNIGPGDEVILPTFTIISCAAAIVRRGAKPVLVDSDPHTWNMAVEHIERKITKKTKAIMAVHIYGLPVDMDPIKELADRYGLKIIEDAAEAIGQTYKGRKCGSFGDVSVFSFYPNKHITTGEGGMVITDDECLVQRCRSLRNLCFQPGRRFVHNELGWNYRMSNIQAAVGVAQFEQLERHIERKREIGHLYDELLKDTPGIQLPLAKTDYAENIYWVYGIVLDEAICGDAGEVMRRLAERKVGTRPFFWSMHEQPVFGAMGLFSGESYPVAERIARRGFYIPSGLALTDGQIRYVAEMTREVAR
ncbi:MAG: DegT/DnrJ/EryC1/StrS family aminotransferase [Deltaproteobacteria bacterium]|nr:DegT/DnrJ/EryC1/StrS family aminotransferase [Deltaproteobacteria bacterium]